MGIKTDGLYGLTVAEKNWPRSVRLEICLDRILTGWQAGHTGPHRSSDNQIRPMAARPVARNAHAGNARRRQLLPDLGAGWEPCGFHFNAGRILWRLSK